MLDPLLQQFRAETRPPHRPTLCRGERDKQVIHSDACHEENGAGWGESKVVVVKVHLRYSGQGRPLWEGNIWFEREEEIPVSHVTARQRERQVRATEEGMCWARARISTKAILARTQVETRRGGRGGQSSQQEPNLGGLWASVRRWVLSQVGEKSPIRLKT